MREEVKRKIGKSVCVFCVTAVLALGILLLANVDVGGNNKMVFANCTNGIFAMAIVYCMFLGCITELHENDKSSRLMVVLLATTLVYLLANLISWAYEGLANADLIRWSATSVNYILGYAVSFVFTLYMRACVYMESKSYDLLIKIIAVLFALSTLLVLINPFTGIYFTYNEEGFYVRGPIFWLSQVYPIGIILIDGIVIFFQKAVPKRTRLSLASYCICPIAGMGIQLFVYGISITELTAVLGIFIIYTNIYIQKSKMIERQRTAIMVSQINPHFVYNALTAIASLCDIDPEKAKETTLDFSAYLRGNIDSLSQSGPISFEKELEHVESYLKIEKQRFGDKINVEYDIRAREFFLPSLSVQPLVENAVRHGICQREGAGLVKISSFETDAHYIVTVEDNGVGFDAKLKRYDDKTHVGLENVSSRVKSVCGGGVTVESERGKGTKIEIKIPKTRGFGL